MSQKGCYEYFMEKEKNKGGRPREHDRDSIMLELLEWAKLPDSINLNGFCCSREPPIPPSYITLYARECPKFRAAYETAKAFLGDRREKMLNMEMLHVKAYDLNASTYDQFLKEEKRLQAEFESNLRKKEDEVKQPVYNITIPHDLAIGSNIPTKTVSD